MEPTSFTLITIIMICIFVILGILVKDIPAKVFAFAAALVVLAFFPIKGDTEVLYQYNFAKFQTHGVIEYVSPFDEELITKDINNIEIYNKLSRNEDLRIRAHYSLFRMKVMETFVRD